MIYGPHNLERLAGRQRFFTQNFSQSEVNQPSGVPTNKPQDQIFQPYGVVLNDWINISGQATFVMCDCLLLMSRNVIHSSVICLFYLEAGPLEYVDFPNDDFQHLHEFSWAKLFQYTW